MSTVWHEYIDKASSSFEISGDRAIAQGDFAMAERRFEQAESHVPANRQGRIIAKLASLPLYELEWRGKIGKGLDEDLLKRVEACHAYTSELLAVYLHRIDELRSQGDYKESTQVLGLISELTVLALGARRFNRKGDYFFVPSSAESDFAGSFANDLRLVNAASGRSLSVQVKTSSKRAGSYSGAVAVLPVQNLDPKFYGRPEHDHSLARSIVREIVGPAGSHDSRRLDAIEDELFDNFGRRFKANTAEAVS